MTDLAQTQMTKPTSNGETPLPKRVPKGLLPSTWVDRTLRLEYIDSEGRGKKTKATLLETYPFGPVLSIAGSKTLIAWERLCLLELCEDR